MSTALPTGSVFRGNATAGGAVRFALLVCLAAGFLWFVPVYASSLRDPRYLDGWVLAGGMALQLILHVGLKLGLSPRAMTRWRTMHIGLGLLLAVVFISHSDFSLPDTAFEWALWAGFVLVSASGAGAAYFAWALRSKVRGEGAQGLDRIAARRDEIERELQSIIVAEDPALTALGLPAPPSEGWISDLYANRLRAFLRRPRHRLQHLTGTQRALTELLGEIDEVARYADSHSRGKLTAIQALVVEKDGLDFEHAHLTAGRALMFVHVPVTYALIVLTLAHGVIVYSFTSGGW